MLGVIGGSGLYALDGWAFVRNDFPMTPWGFPSAKIITVERDKIRIAFLPRHGNGHSISPTEVNSRANIAALKHIGCTAIIAFSAVGSLREEIKPTDFVLPSQIIDRTKGIRPSTFFSDGIVAHASFADPFDSEIAALISSSASQVPGLVLHCDKTLVCMEGPQFSTRAESILYRNWGCDIINMSVLPEAKLAREVELPYQMICMATDYDAWREGIEGVDANSVMQTMEENSRNAKLLLSAFAEKVGKEVSSGRVKGLKGSMKFSIITAENSRNEKSVEKLKYVLPDYF